MRFDPSPEFHSPRPLARLLLIALWSATLVAAIAAHGWGTWRIYEDERAARAFASLGVAAMVQPDGTIAVIPTHPQTASVIGDGALLQGVAGRDLAPGTGLAAASQPIIGPDGSRVRLRLLLSDGTSRQADFVRSEASTRIVFDPISVAVGSYLMPVMGLLAALLGVTAAALMIWRRSHENFAILLSFGLIALVATSQEALMSLGEIGLFPVWVMAVIFALAVLIALLPALPNGRYRVASSRWLRWLVPACAAALLAASLYPEEPLAQVGGDLAYDALLLLALWSLGASILGYRRTPAGPEKQQLKWAAFGLFFGLPLILAGFTLMGTTEAYPDWPQAWIVDAGAVLAHSLGSVLVSLGLLLSLLGIRLNDADGAIGRSAGYALITLVIGAVWAGTTAWTNKYIGTLLGPDGAALSTGLSTLLAAAIFVPARERILKWTESRFQPALVRLRALPRKLEPLKHDHDQAELARSALAAIAGGIRASRAAIVVAEGDGTSVIAVHGSSGEEVRAASMIEADGSLFPLRFELSDLLGPIGTLLVGPRDDGARYNSDERAALKLVLPALAEALRATGKRADRNASIAARLERIEKRLAVIERPRPPGRSSLRQAARA